MMNMLRFPALGILLVLSSTATGSFHSSIADPKLHLFQPHSSFSPHEIQLQEESFQGIGHGKVLIAHEIGKLGTDRGYSEILGHDFGEHRYGLGIHGGQISHGNHIAGGKRFGHGLDLITIPLLKNVPVIKHVPVVKKVPVIQTVEVVRHIPVVKSVPIVQHLTVIAGDAGGGGLVHGLGKSGSGHGVAKNEYDHEYHYGGGHHDVW